MAWFNSSAFVLNIRLQIKYIALKWVKSKELKVECRQESLWKSSGGESPRAITQVDEELFLELYKEVTTRPEIYHLLIRYYALNVLWCFD